MRLPGLRQAFEQAQAGRAALQEELDLKTQEIVALSESKRTESNWIKTRVIDEASDELVAEVILNSATLKESYEKYEEDARALGLNL